MTLASDVPGGHAGSETYLSTSEMHLCPWLRVPEGMGLACVVPNICCGKRQELTFNVDGVQGGPLFQVRISEFSKYEAGIHLETLQGWEQLAFLSTEELWLGSITPKLAIYKNGGAYGSVQLELNG